MIAGTRLLVPAAGLLAGFLVYCAEAEGPPATRFPPCSTGADKGRSASALVRELPAAPGDLPFLEITSKRTAATVRIYHDSALIEPAKRRAACFIAMLDLLAPGIPDNSRGIPWAPIVLTRDTSYVPPSRDGERRWPITLAAGHWDAESERALFYLMPHEETHQRQAARRHAPLPRWFQEGHAEWAGLKVTKLVRPDIEAARRALLARASSGKPHPSLAKWGGVRVKKEAIARQLSPTDLARWRADPDFVPPGPFKFGPGDFEVDTSEPTGGLDYYAAALALFEAIERRHGAPATKRWIDDVLASGDNAAILPLAKKDLGEDIERLLD